MLSSKSNFLISRLNSIPILEVAHRLEIRLKSKRTICWLHDDRDPSMSFDIKRNRWKCFGCGASGGVIDLVISKTGLIFSDACKWLCYEFDINSDVYFSRTKRKPIKLVVNDIKPIHNFLPDTEIYKWLIDNAIISNKAKHYLVVIRNFPEYIINKYNIKSTCDKDGLFQKCLLKFGFERMLKAGLAIVKKNKKGEEFEGFVWYGEVLLFPFFNENNEIIYIQARRIDSISRFKYICLNQVETVPYNLSIICGLRAGDTVVLCEGVLDCISLGLFGKKSIGIIGAHGFKRKYIYMLSSYNIIVIPDSDEPGLMFAKKIEKNFLDIGHKIQILHLPKEYKDITEFYESTIK